MSHNFAKVDPNLYKSLADGIRTIRTTEGPSALALGWLPTFIGYSKQGLGKFGFYEVFKDVYKGIVGEETAAKYRRVGWSVASGSAEVIADVLLCPWEALKVRIQTSKPGTFPTNTVVAFNQMKSNEGERGSSLSFVGVQGFYKGLVPLWTRQIPYTIVKFVAFEQIVTLFYDHVFTKPKNQYSKGTQLS